MLGYTGQYCQILISECASNPCDPIGASSCVDGVEMFTCICNNGYSGITCVTEIDECVSLPCFTGECTDIVNGFICSCPFTYTGIMCDVAILPSAQCIYDTISFNSPGDAILLNNTNPLFSVEGTNLTISFYVKPFQTIGDPTPNPIVQIGQMGLDGIASNSRAWFGVVNGAYYFASDIYGDSAIVSDSNLWLGVDYGTWVQLSVTIDSICLTATIYRNGEVIGSIGIDEFLYNASTQVLIGGSSCWVSQVGIWTTNLNESTIFEMGVMRIYPQQSQVLLVPMNTTTDIVDYSPNAATQQPFVILGSPTLIPPQPDPNNCVTCGCPSGTCCTGGANGPMGVCSALMDVNNCNGCGVVCDTNSGFICCCNGQIPCYCGSSSNCNSL